MAKKIKFPLILKDGVQVRNLEELKENFDFEKIYEYFLNGKLATWLEDRYYEEESQQIQELNSSDNGLKKKIYEIFSVDYKEDDTDLEELERRSKKMGLLKQLTSDNKILEKVDQTAFNQEELADLLDDGIREIYLCNGQFTIPIKIKGCHYIGVGTTVISINSKQDISLDELDIILENVEIKCAEAIHVIASKSINTKGLNIKAEENCEFILECIPIYSRYDEDTNISTYSPEPFARSERSEGPVVIALFAKEDSQQQKRLISILNWIEFWKTNSGTKLYGVAGLKCQVTTMESLLAYGESWFYSYKNNVFFLRNIGEVGEENKMYPVEYKYTDLDAVSGLYKENLLTEVTELIISGKDILSYLKTSRDVNCKDVQQWDRIIITDIFSITDESIMFTVKIPSYNYIRTTEFLMLLKYRDNSLIILNQGDGGFFKIYSDDQHVVYADCSNEAIMQYNIQSEYSVKIAGNIANMGRYTYDYVKENPIVYKEGKLYFVETIKESAPYISYLMVYDMEEDKKERIKELHYATKGYYRGSRSFFTLKNEKLCFTCPYGRDISIEGTEDIYIQ